MKTNNEFNFPNAKFCLLDLKHFKMFEKQKIHVFKNLIYHYEKFKFYRDKQNIILPPTLRTAVDVLTNLPEVAVQIYVPESSYLTEDIIRRPCPSSTALPGGSSPFSFAQVITIGS